MSSSASQPTPRSLFIAPRDPVARNARIEKRIRSRMERERARQHSGTVRVRTSGRSAREQLQRDLPREVMKWSRKRTLRIVDLIVPEIEPAAGAVFTAHGRVSSRAVVFVHCKIRRRWPLTQITTVEFRIMDGLS